jgi:hypothetical protein
MQTERENLHGCASFSSLPSAQDTDLTPFIGPLQELGALELAPLDEASQHQKKIDALLFITSIFAT